MRRCKKNVGSRCRTSQMLECNGILVWLGAVVAAASMRRTAAAAVLMQIGAQVSRGSDLCSWYGHHRVWGIHGQVRQYQRA